MYGITTEKLNRIKPFTVFGFDIFRLGWLEYNFEGLVGIPEIFYSNNDQISTTGIRVCI